MSLSYRIYIVEVYFDGNGDPNRTRWIPMYQPCYTWKEADTKAKSKKYSTTRVSRYERTEIFPEIHRKRE